MKLLKRVNMVITAQLHEVVECFENPERILEADHPRDGGNA